jgi:hypothetical protein
MSHETAAATDLSHAPPVAVSPHELIVLEDTDLLTLFQSEGDVNRPGCLVATVSEGTGRETESVTRVIAADARIDQLLDRLQLLEESCERIARSVADVEVCVETARQRLQTTPIPTSARQWRGSLRNACAVIPRLISSPVVRTNAVAASECVRNLSVRYVSPFSTRMTLRVALLVAAVTGAVLLAGLDHAGVRSTVSVRPAVHRARTADIVLGTDRSDGSGSVSNAVVTNALLKEPPAANSTRTRRRAARFVGTLVVESKPAGAVVMVDQRKVGVTPARIAEIPAGSHAIWVVGNNHQRWTSAVTVRASSVTRVVAYLETPR